MVSGAGLPSGYADTEDLYTVTAGPVDELSRFTVDAPVDGTPAIQSASPLTLTLWSSGLATYSDLVVLPGSSLLLGDGAGRGAVIFDETGQQIDELDDADQRNRPASVVAAGFIEPDWPDLLLMSNTHAGQVLLYDVVDETNTWNHGLVRDGIPASIQRAVVLPDDRVAVAASWPQLQISTVEILPIENSPSPELTLLSDADAAKPDQVVIDDLHPIRDLMADVDGRLLITSRDKIHLLDHTGGLIWDFHIGDESTIGGQFQAAHLLQSDLIAAATRQPGVWNQPHFNHRIHLFDPDASEPYVDSSPSLDAAPLQLDSTDGHGGTGTRGYAANAFDVDQSSPAELTVHTGPEVQPAGVALDDVAQLGFDVSNQTQSPVSARRAHFRVADGRCDQSESEAESGTNWWTYDGSRTIDIQQSWTVDGEPLIADRLSVGTWCGVLILIGRDGTSHRLGSSVDIEILPPEGGSSEQVATDDLGRVTGPDAGFPHAPGQDADAPEGCACSTHSGPFLPPLISLAALLLVVVVTRLTTGLRRPPSTPVIR